MGFCTAMKPYHTQSEFEDGEDFMDENEVEAEIFGAQRAERLSLEDKCFRHLHGPVVNADVYPIYFWKMRKTEFPTLHKAAVTFLAIPASSTPSERTFSLGRQIISDYRGSLNPGTIRRLMCLNRWLKTEGLSAVFTHLEELEALQVLLLKHSETPCNKHILRIRLDSRSRTTKRNMMLCCNSNN